MTTRIVRGGLGWDAPEFFDGAPGYRWLVAGCTVQHFPSVNYTRTILPDGSVCQLRAEYEPQFAPIAMRAGYGGVGEGLWRFMREHDIVHSFLAEKAGNAWSPVLFFTAHAALHELDKHAIETEERMVYDFQRMLIAPDALVPVSHRAWVTEFKTRFAVGAADRLRGGVRAPD